MRNVFFFFNAFQIVTLLPIYPIKKKRKNSFTYIPNNTLKHPCELNYKNYHETYFIRIKNLANANFLEESDNLKIFLWKSDDGMYRMGSFMI